MDRVRSDTNNGNVLDFLFNSKFRVIVLTPKKGQAGKPGKVTNRNYEALSFENFLTEKV